MAGNGSGKKPAKRNGNGSGNRGPRSGANGYGNGKTLTAKQSAFFREYLIDFNATRAAIRAGYSSHSAEDIGRELLRKPLVAEAVQIAIARRAVRTGVRADRVVIELARIAFADIRSVVDFGPGGATIRQAEEITEDDAAAIASLTSTETEHATTVHVRMADKLAALTLLGKHLGMFAEKHILEGGATPINITLGATDDAERLAAAEAALGLARKALKGNGSV